MSITVVKPGLQTTVQSRPRTGHRHRGVPASGAADPLSLALANRLVGNAWDAPALEASLLGPTLRFAEPCAVALSGAVADAAINGKAVPFHETLRVAPDDELAIGAARTGARVYVAFAGGLVVDEVLGSGSTYLQAAFGGIEGRALVADDTLIAAGGGPRDLQTPAAFRPPMSSSWALRSCASLETPQLTPASREHLFGSNWVIGRRADRMGLKLEGPGLEVTSDGRMPSAAVFPGTVQCPEDGTPYVLSIDAGTVGGYPRIAQVARADRHLLGQLRPGDHLRLLFREPDDAVAELRAKLDYWREWLPDIDEVLC
jgi:biotin-dependent carboxylase-like uncharacterized protein